MLKNFKNNFVRTLKNPAKSGTLNINNEIKDIKAQLRFLLQFLLGSGLAVLLALFAAFYFMRDSLSRNFETRFASFETRFSSHQNSIENIYGLLLRKEGYQALSNRSVEIREKLKNPGWHSRIYLFLEDFSKIKDLFDLKGKKEFENAAYASWSPNSNEMVFISLTGKDEILGNIYVYNFSTDSLERISNGADEESKQPKFSWDGKKIAYSKRNSTKNRWDIFTFDRANKKVERLTDESDSVKDESNTTKELIGNRNEYPSWSPDGNYIAFCSTNTLISNEGFTLFLMDKNGSHKTEICKIGDTCKPSFSPDGKWLLFETENGKSHNDIWIAPLINGKCTKDKSQLSGYEDITNLEKEGNYYFLKLTDRGGDKTKNANIDPVWLSKSEVMYLSTDEIAGKPSFSAIDVNWTVRKINIFSGRIQELPLQKSKYRNPQTRTFFTE